MWEGDSVAGVSTVLDAYGRSYSGCATAAHTNQERLMRDLRDMSIGHRIALTVVICIVILFALALYGYLTGGWEAQAQAQQQRYLLQSLPASKYEKRLLELDREAADNAYRDQIEHLFQTWMKDDSGQPQRAATGARQARAAYERVMHAIELRDRLVRDSGPTP